MIGISGIYTMAHCQIFWSQFVVRDDSEKGDGYNGIYQGVVPSIYNIFLIGIISNWKYFVYTAEFYYEMFLIKLRCIYKIFQIVNCGKNIQIYFQNNQFRPPHPLRSSIQRNVCRIFSMFVFTHKIWRWCNLNSFLVCWGQQTSSCFIEKKRKQLSRCR